MMYIIVCLRVVHVRMFVIECLTTNKALRPYAIPILATKAHEGRELPGLECQGRCKHLKNRAKIGQLPLCALTLYNLTWTSSPPMYLDIVTTHRIQA